MARPRVTDHGDDLDMLSKTFIRDLVLDTHIRSTFVVSAKATRQTKYGDDYLCVTLTDRTGSIEARAWENARMLAQRFDTSDFVVCAAVVCSYQDTLQLKLNDIERVDETQVDATDFLPSSRWDKEALFAQLKELVLTEVTNPLMRDFFKTLFGQADLMRKFKLAPAAKSNHHNYLSGLLEHVLSMARIATNLADHYGRYYPGLINKDLLLAGCILHDIGKCRELSFSRSFNYTTHGQLIGHIVHGVELVNEIAAAMPRQAPEEMLLEIKHLILSHHGRLDYGSPVKPKTPEAMLLHEVDMIDSRMNMCHMFIAQHEELQNSSAPDRWTSYNRPLETSLYLGGEHDAIWRATPAWGDDELVGPGAASRTAEAPSPHHARAAANTDAPRASANRDPRPDKDPTTLDLFRK